MGIYAWLRVLHIISQQRCEIERWFQRTTYRKLHIRSPMVTWLMTSRDPKTHYGVKNSGKIREEVYSNGLYALSISAKINDLGWPWRAITHSVSKHMRLSEPTTKIWMKTGAWYNQRRWCSPMTRDSGNIRFMRIFAVVLKIYVNFPYIYECLCPYKQVWYAVLVVKISSFVRSPHLLCGVHITTSVWSL